MSDTTSKPTARSAEPAVAVDVIYAALERGVGRERVDDQNVAALIAMAHDKHNAQLEYLLREWRSTCGDDPDAPDLTQVQGLPPA